MHADSSSLAFEQLTLLVKESEGGQDLDRADIRNLLDISIDLIVQCKRIAGRFRVMKDHDAGDASQVEPLLDQIDMPIGQFTADGAYDGEPTYDAVTNHNPDAAVIIPPRANAVDRKHTDPSSQRARHIAAIDTDGRMNWQAATGYGERSLVEIAIGRYKSIIGRRLRPRFAAQQTEVALGCDIINRMLACGPTSVRCTTASA